MRTRSLFLALVASSLSAMAGCGAEYSEQGCYFFDDCAPDLVCAGVDLTDEPAQCVPLTECASDPTLPDRMRDNFESGRTTPAPQGRWSVCEKDAPLRCIPGRDDEYLRCSLRDAYQGTGCYFDVVWDDPNAGPFTSETATCDSAGCFDVDGVATCIPPCARNEECPSGACRLRAGNGTLTCASEGSGPTVASMCSVTILDAEAISNSSLEGTESNNPDLYVVVSAGERRETTAIEEGTKTPVWNTTYEGFPFRDIANMQVELYEDDVDNIFGSNDDDLVGRWDRRGGTWFIEDMSKRFDFQVPDVIARLSLRIDCQ